MKKGLFDMLLDQIMKERDREESSIPSKDDPEKDLSMEEEAKRQVKLREKKKLDELLNKKKKEVEEKVQKLKRVERESIREQERKEAARKLIQFLETPTDRLTWKCVSGSNNLQGSSNDSVLFEIRRGISAFELRPMSNGNEKVNMRLRLKQLRTSNIFTDSNVERLKSKADKLLERVEKMEAMKVKEQSKTPPQQP